jgi:chromosome segregation ATPase
VQLRDEIAETKHQLRQAQSQIRELEEKMGRECKRNEALTDLLDVALAMLGDQGRLRETIVSGLRP